MNKLIFGTALLFFFGFDIYAASHHCPKPITPTSLPTPVITTRPSGATITIYDFTTLKIHAFTAPKPALRTSTYVLEGPKKLVIIEPQFMNSLAKDFRSYIDSLKKPLDRIIISDRDPDHYFGLAAAFKNIPAYALPTVIATINKSGPALLEERRKIFGPEMPEQHPTPKQSLSTGNTVIDCIKYQFDSSTDDEGGLQVTLTLPEYHVLFTGDISSNKCHLVPGKATQERLSAFEKNASNYLLILPGNGVPTDNKIFAENLKYLQSVAKFLAESPTPEDYQARIIKSYPDYDCEIYFNFYVPAYYKNRK